MAWQGYQYYRVLKAMVETGGRDVHIDTIRATLGGSSGRLSGDFTYLCRIGAVERTGPGWYRVLPYAAELLGDEARLRAELMAARELGKGQGPPRPGLRKPRTKAAQATAQEAVQKAAQVVEPAAQPSVEPAAQEAVQSTAKGAIEELVEAVAKRSGSLRVMPDGSISVRF